MYIQAGLLGDRTTRPMALVGWTLVGWAVGAIGCTVDWGFVPFLIFRCLMAVGETVLAVVDLPLIIGLSPSTSPDQRLQWVLFLVASIPTGSGVGYIAGAFISREANGGWQWAVRVPALVALMVAVGWRRLTRGGDDRRLVEARGIEGQNDENGGIDVGEMWRSVFSLLKM